ncbi:MAG TPA: BTAD domain-containing putative transcriptional regulator [Gaiella sp.]|nr:BTAD domain-containing putative transcriptional regulator [Gaiella sp.]
MALELRILGPLEILRDGQTVRLEGRLRRSLVALLVLHARETVSSDRLIEELWPGNDRGGRARLQVYVSQLRRALGPDARALETRPNGYALAVEPDALDASRFERLVAVGREALSAGEPERAAAALVEALALWRGPALADLVYESFAQAEAARLEELRLAAVEDRIDAELALGRHGELVAELERLVAEHPLRERLRGQLMLALYRSGRQADALAAFHETRRHLDEELGLEPGPELKDLQRAILRHDPVLRVEAPELRARRHLPAPPTSLVGRERELEELGALVRSESARLLTLTGAGGSGKTRLALQVAHDLADAFADGVYFVDLSQLRDSTLVPPQIARALDLEEHRDRPMGETLQAYLRGRRLLLLLDNFELVDEAAPFLGELLAAAPGLGLLVTSRTPLRLSAEHEYRVPPLPPDDAARLFVARARAVAPGFRRPSEEAAEVAEICLRLDCLPLAIELAAARTRELAPAEMLALLPSSLELASGGARDLPARQQTLRATIDWSYELLMPEERELFARLAVFRGGCTSAAVEEVCLVGRDALASLVAKSLLRERPGPGGEPRYLMLETVREYALERLAASGEGELLRERHARHLLALAERLEEEVVAGAELGPRLDRLSAEHENARAALAWCHDTGAMELELRLAGALARFWAVRGYLREGRRWLEHALQQPAPPGPARSKALAGAIRLEGHLGDYAKFKALAQERLALCRSLGDRHGEAWALDRLATAWLFEGELDRGMSLYKQSAAISRELGDGRGLAVSLTSMGYQALVEGDHERAIGLSEQALALYETLGQQEEMLAPLLNLGLAVLSEGRHREAHDVFRRGLELAQNLGYTDIIVYCLEAHAAVLAPDEPRKATTLLGAAEAAAEANGLRLEPLERELHERTVESVRVGLGADTFGAVHAAGRGLELHQAVELALGTEVETAPARPS